jgi:hypothetical protein
MRRLWRRLKAGLQPAPIETPAALATFLEERAAFIAQKCAIDYCRGKTGLASYALFEEKPFQQALDVCRWETFAAALSDLFLLAEGQLRPHVVPERRERLRRALVQAHGAVLSGQPLPAHRQQGWEDALASFAARLAAAAAGEAPRALDVADHSAKRLFDTLPIHISMRQLDEEVVYGAVRFRMIAVAQQMQLRFVPAELARQLTV